MGRAGFVRRPRGPVPVGSRRVLFQVFVCAFKTLTCGCKDVYCAYLRSLNSGWFRVPLYQGPVDPATEPSALSSSHPLVMLTRTSDLKLREARIHPHPHTHPRPAPFTPPRPCPFHITSCNPSWSKPASLLDSSPLLRFAAQICHFPLRTHTPHKLAPSCLNHRPTSSPRERTRITPRSVFMASCWMGF